MADLIKRIKEWFFVGLGSVGAFLLVLLGIRKKQNEELKKQNEELKEKVAEAKVTEERQEFVKQKTYETVERLDEKKQEQVEELQKIFEESKDQKVSSVSYNDLVNRWNK